MKKIMSVFILVSLVLVACSDASYGKSNMEAYAWLKDSNHAFVDATFQDVNKEMIGNEKFSGVVYFGYSDCPWCKEAVPVLNKVAKKYKEKIYYVDKQSSIHRDFPNWEEETARKLDKAYGLDVDEDSGKPVIYVPEVIVIKKGIIMSRHLGTTKTHDARERRMNEEEERSLQASYEALFEEISTSE